MGIVRLQQIEALRDRTGVFADRRQAGLALAELVAQLNLPAQLVLAIPSGGVPVAAPLAEALGCRLDVAVVSKITLPWNSEAGYGAVAFDGSCLLNQPMIEAVGLSDDEVARGIERTRAKVARRVAALQGKDAMIDLAARQVVVVDDGLASGFTMQAAVNALRRAGVATLTVAVPTGHEHALRELAGKVDHLCCANVRSGPSFAVAAAYLHWCDVSEAEAVQLLQESRD